MKDTIKFCDKTIADNAKQKIKNKPAIQNDKAILKASMEREDFSEIDKND